MRRRHFLLSLGAAACCAEGDPLSRIGISSWSFHNLFTATRAKNAPPLAGKVLDVLDFPEMVADRFHVHNLEVVAPHFDSASAAYFVDFRARLNKAHSRLVNIPADIAGLWEAPGLSSGDPEERRKTIALYSKWVDNAKALGAGSIRCDPGKINLADLAPTIDSYKKLVAYGRSKEIAVIVENHGSASTHPEELAAILKASGAGALPDFGNFPDNATRDRGLRLLFPLAGPVCHAKLNPARFDLAGCIRIAKEAGFKGIYSIEAGGNGDPYDAVQQVLEQLTQHL